MRATVLKITISTLLITLTACGDSEHRIASIDEASGISYCRNSNTLMVANDEGSFYEIDPKGNILSRHKLGDYDLEGVVCEDDDIIFTIEGGSILRVNRKSLQSREIRIEGRDFKFNKKSGIEGIAKVGDIYYLAIQEKKDKSKAKLLVVDLKKNRAVIKKIINHKILQFGRVGVS